MHPHKCEHPKYVVEALSRRPVCPRNEIFDAMAATYGERVKVWPELAFAQDNFQNLLHGPSGPAQATLYIAFHAIHYSAIFKFRARPRSSPIQDSDNDLAVKVYY